jgi:hypothetical protein
VIRLLGWPQRSESHPSELNPNGKTDPGTLHQSPAGKPAGFKKIVKSTKKVISIIKLLITT